MDTHILINEKIKHIQKPVLRKTETSPIEMGLLQFAIKFDA